MNDIRNYMIAAPWFSRVSHLESAQAGVNPVYTLEYPGWIAFIKGPKGYPFDLNTVDLAAGVIRQLYTEGPNGWTDPTSTKQFVSKSTTDGGINWAPLDIDADNGDLIDTPDSSYEVWQGGKVVSPTPPPNVGVVSVRVDKPTAQVVGALGEQAVVLQHYYWGQTEEVNWYALGYGLVRWQQKTLKGSEYVLVTDNLFDQVKPGPTPRLVPPTGFTI